MTIRKFWALLPRGFRRRAALIGIGMLVGAVLEMVGIGLIIPVLAAMMSFGHPGGYAPAPLASIHFSQAGSSLILTSMLALVVIYAVKSLFLAFQAWRQSRFAYGLQASISQRLFDTYLARPYVFHLQRNSAQLIGNITTECEVLVHGGVLPAMALLAEMMVLAGLVLLLLAVEPLGVLAFICLIGPPCWFFYRWTRARITGWGKSRQVHDGMRLQHLQQGLGGVKEVKLLGREVEFSEQYRTHVLGSTNASQRQAFLRQLPRLALEMLSVLGMAGLACILIMQNREPAALLPALGLFSLAAMRIAQCATRIIASAQNLRYAGPVIERIFDELEGTGTPGAPANGRPLHFESTLEMRGISFRYPGAGAYSLHNIEVRIPKGQCIGFVGESGAGKSTLVDVILGLLEPEQGLLEVDGVDVRAGLRSWQDKIGYVPQSIFLTDDTLRRNIAFGIAEEKIDDEAVRRAIRAAQLDVLVQGFPAGINELLGEKGARISGGQRQRIGIARAIYHDPQLLVLDEATSALDVDTERNVMEAVRGLMGKTTILIVAHRLSTVEYCDRVYRLERGELTGDARPGAGGLPAN